MFLIQGIQCNATQKMLENKKSIKYKLGQKRIKQYKNAKTHTVYSNLYTVFLVAKTRHLVRKVRTKRFLQVLFTKMDTLLVLALPKKSDVWIITFSVKHHINISQ